ncbi:MAG TPA: prepilin peptidase [Candidatus Eisenbacteria bacterium]|nr:prepilin peptidase [Candidatus Eisenbacteria bacterium]
MTIAAFFLFGLVIGSFLNVCITRIPGGASIISPRSRCPHCATRIKPYDNVPVLSWFLLGGKCRNCHAPISPMYPAVELVTALLFVACYLCFGLSLPAFKWIFFISILVVLVVTDFRERILPDVVNWFGVGLGLVFAAYVPPVDGVVPMLLHRFIALPRWSSGVLDGLLGAIFCGGLLWLTAWLYKAIRHRDGMGFGDVKMMFMVGTFLGLRGAFLTILLGTFLGTVVGLAVIGFLFASGWKKSLAERASKMGLGHVGAIRWAIASRYQLPLGSFLGVAALLVTFFSPWTLSRCAVFLFG